MATPLTPDRLLSAARACGARVVEVGSWRTHNRNSVGRWGPVHGIMIHYTAGDSGPPANDAAYNRNILYKGYAGLPGPLSQFGIGRDGTVYLNSAGRCNHAGRIDDDALDLMIRSFANLPFEPGLSNEKSEVDAEAFGLMLDGALPLDQTYTAPEDEPAGVVGLLPLDRTHVPGADVVDGNARLYGIEIINRGTPSETQLDAAARVCAGICLAYGWSGADVMGHGEGTRRKTNDPPGVNMGAFRRRVMALVAAARNPAQPVTIPKPSPKSEDVMPDHYATRTVMRHDGKGWQLPSNVAVKPRDKAMRISATATVTAPPGVNLRTRWVSWPGGDAKDFVRYAPTGHASNEAETSTIVAQAWPGASLEVDVWADQECDVTVETDAFIWETP